MRLVAPILIISWGVCLAGAAREKLGDGDVESLRRMVRNSIFDPVKPNTLPFSSLQEQLPPRTRRKKICAECMAKLLALEFEEFLPEGGRPIQQMADTQTWNDEGRLIYVDALEWYWTGRRMRPISQWTRPNAASLAWSCTRLLTALKPPTVCSHKDFDQGLSHIYDPKNNILVVRVEQENRRFGDDEMQQRTTIQDDDDELGGQPHRFTAAQNPIGAPHSSGSTSTWLDDAGALVNRVVRQVGHAAFPGGGAGDGVGGLKPGIGTVIRPIPLPL